MVVVQTTAITGSPETAEALHQQGQFSTACKPATAKAGSQLLLGDKQQLGSRQQRDSKNIGNNNNRRDKQQLGQQKQQRL
jgi:hypothetical protein